MKPELTIMDAVRIARREAARGVGDYRAALTMLADLGEYHHGRQARDAHAGRAEDGGEDVESDARFEDGLKRS